MLSHIRANLLLLVFTVLICTGLYPLALLGIGQALFHDKAEGSIIHDKGDAVVGSRLIAQPFTADEYFWPRPSAASYNGAASGASNWGANNYQLRDRVARALGPIVKYRSGPKKGQLAGPDVEAWFRMKDTAVPAGQIGIVGRWATDHSALAQNWVKADKLNGEYVSRWQREHPAEVEAWKKANPDTPEPKPGDLAGPFFESFSKSFPGAWPVAVEHKTADGKTEKRIEPVKEGSDIQGVFFDGWRQEHPDADLEDVPADMVMASGSGLDPHITMQNAHYQLDRVTEAWAKKTKMSLAEVRAAIEKILAEKQEAPLAGLVGVPLVNVLETNLALKAHFEGSPQTVQRN
jgi:potassium-transporting ATPase KdpC subunit